MKIKNLRLKIKNYSKGFTLIELLIVIAIIGILSALLMANFIGVRQRARDAQRKADLRQIQSALEIYRSDSATGNYPDQSLVVCGQSLDNGATTPTVYMKKIPCDPQGAGYWYSGQYFYDNPNGTDYTLAACLENSADSTSGTTATSPSGSDANCPSKWYYVLTNP